jgi:hypothetical protein
VHLTGDSKASLTLYINLLDNRRRFWGEFRRSIRIKAPGDYGLRGRPMTLD